MSEQPPATTRIRITYGKSGSLRYIGNLDMTRVWERTLRRSRLPLAYSQGFSPRPRFQVASSLPLGATSRCELLDVWFVNPPALDAIAAALRESAPPGLEIVAVHEAPPRQPALQAIMQSSEYILTIHTLPAAIDLAESVRRVLAAAALPREWRGKAYDLRALIEHLEVIQPTQNGKPRLQMRLSAREGANGRPEEVLSALGLDPLSAAIERTALDYGGDR